MSSFKKKRQSPITSANTTGTIITWQYPTYTIPSTNVKPLGTCEICNKEVYYSLYRCDICGKKTCAECMNELRPLEVTQFVVIGSGTMMWAPTPGQRVSLYICKSCSDLLKLSLRIASAKQEVEKSGRE